MSNCRCALCNTYIMDTYFKFGSMLVRLKLDRQFGSKLNFKFQRTLSSLIGSVVRDAGITSLRTMFPRLYLHIFAIFCLKFAPILDFLYMIIVRTVVLSCCYHLMGLHKASLSVQIFFPSKSFIISDNNRR